MVKTIKTKYFKNLKEQTNSTINENGRRYKLYSIHKDAKGTSWFSKKLKRDGHIISVRKITGKTSGYQYAIYMKPMKRK